VGASGATEVVVAPPDAVRVDPDMVGSARGGGVEVQAAPTRSNVTTVMPKTGRVSAGTDTRAR
jgi:hypothetical protein